LLAGVAAVAVVLLMVIAALGNLASPSSPVADSGAVLATGSGSVINGTLEYGAKIALTAPTFWGVVATTAQSTGISTDAALGQYLNASPFVSFSYTEDSDQCNVTTNTLWSDSGVPSVGCPLSFSAFKAWCDSRGPTCVSIVDLPGENNNSAEDANIANYIVHVIGFQPTYWGLGDEPELWTHYGIPWSQWRSTDNSTASAVAYAVDLRGAIAAVAPVDPAAKWIGIQSDCGECSLKYIQTVAKVIGTSVQAFAFHIYPSVRLQNVTQAQFFSALTSKTNLTNAYTKVRQNITKGCPSCASLPIFVTEYNSGPGWGPTNYAGTYQDAVFLAASMVQGLRVNASMIDIYNLQTTQPTFAWAMLNVTNALSPEAVLYEQLFEHLRMGWVLGTTVRTSLPGVYDVETYVPHSSARSLLIVNTNQTRSLKLHLAKGIVVAPGSTSTIYAWNQSSDAPVPSSVRSMPSYFVVPPEGILMIDFTY
jgi:hypothetical protein